MSNVIVTVLHSLIWYFTAILSLLLCTPFLILAKIKLRTLNPEEYNRYIHRIVSSWAYFNVKTSGAKFKIDGLENIPKDKAVVFVSNHQGDFDIAAFLAFLPVPHGYVAKIEITQIPLVRGWMKSMRCVFIDRKSLRQTAGAMSQGIKTLAEGHSLVLFPEGTRSKSDTMGEFKVASFKLATKAKVPIVPVSINGTYQIMEANKGLIKPANVYVKIHPAIPTDNISIEDATMLPGQVSDIIKKGLL